MDYRKLCKSLLIQLRHVKAQRDYYNRELLCERTARINAEESRAEWFAELCKEKKLRYSIQRSWHESAMAYYSSSKSIEIKIKV